MNSNNQHQYSDTDVDQMPMCQVLSELSELVRDEEIPNHIREDMRASLINARLQIRHLEACLSKK